MAFRDDETSEQTIARLTQQINKLKSFIARNGLKEPSMIDLADVGWLWSNGLALTEIAAKNQLSTSTINHKYHKWLRSLTPNEWMAARINRYKACMVKPSMAGMVRTGLIADTLDRVDA